MEQDQLEQIEIPTIKQPKKPSIVVNNFYSLLTIIIMSVVIIWYVNYILPQQKIAQHKHMEIQKKYQQREQQIKLSQKLHKKYKNDKK